MRCACAVHKIGYFRPVFPDGQGDRGHHCVPMHSTAQIMSQNKGYFALKIPSCCLNVLFLPCGHMAPRWWMVFRVETGKLTHYWALCPRCAETPLNPLDQRAGHTKDMALHTSCTTGNPPTFMEHPQRKGITGGAQEWLP